MFLPGNIPIRTMIRGYTVTCGLKDSGLVELGIEL